ncbi:hypothetical protein TUBRATIS_25110 [Tubulinosema ratisbonensis]|uniref:Uncharacterized protein n=1 Tax=Tubulinosema ratisbonensis TaxID=291195 RepID=A0A437AIQ9_9MICR|nr:hypothetical protein TUBRATIS_25110 [Tubulinosema ratisbonensis]
MKYKNTNYSKNNKKNSKNEVVNTKPTEETTSKKNVNENYHIAENKGEDINLQNRKKETISTEKQTGKPKNSMPVTEESKKDDKNCNSFNLDELKSIIYECLYKYTKCKEPTIDPYIDIKKFSKYFKIDTNHVVKILKKDFISFDNDLRKSLYSTDQLTKDSAEKLDFTLTLMELGTPITHLVSSYLSNFSSKDQIIFTYMGFSIKFLRCMWKYLFTPRYYVNRLCINLFFSAVDFVNLKEYVCEN